MLLFIIEQYTLLIFRKFTISMMPKAERWDDDSDFEYTVHL